MGVLCMEIFLMTLAGRLSLIFIYSLTAMQSYRPMGVLCLEIFLMTLPHPLSHFYMHKQQYKTLLVDPEMSMHIVSYKNNFWHIWPF